MTDNSRGMIVMQDGKLLRCIFCQIPLLPDIICLTACNRLLRVVGMNIMRDRWEGIVRPFVGGHLVEFRHIMQASHALITGSCVLAMLLGEHIKPNDLNIVVPKAGRALFHSFLTSELRYPRVQRRRPNKAFRTATRTFTVFERRGKVVTLSKAFSDGPLKVIIQSQTTADMLGMSAGGLVSFYPQLTVERKIALKNHTLRGLTHKQWVGCMATSHFPSYDSSDFINGPCGPRCPTLWRKVADDGEESLTLQWDTRFPIREQLDSSRLIWRITQCCRNAACMSNRQGRIHQRALPPDPVPSTMHTIALQECHIANHQPVCI